MSVLFVKQRSSVSKQPFKGLRDNGWDSTLARWNAHSRHPIGYNWTFFASSYSWRTMSENTSNSPFVQMSGSLRLNIRLKCYVSTNKNFKLQSCSKTIPVSNCVWMLVADFIWLNLNFTHKNDKFAFWAPFVVVWNNLRTSSIVR